MSVEAKAVAIHDLSFWSTTLPLVGGLQRVMRSYAAPCGTRVPMTLDSDRGRRVHDGILEAMSARNTDGPPDGGVSPYPFSLLVDNLREALEARLPVGEPRVEVPVPGCGVVTGGSCDLLWGHLLVELKLTAKDPSVRDVRQVLTYLGLMALSGWTLPTTGMVANPRRGILVEFNLAELLLATGGLSVSEFADRLGEFLVAEGQSG